MKKILIVDNSIVIINVLKDLFIDNSNFEVVVARNFDEVQKQINDNKFFLAISNTVLSDALNGELIDLLDQTKIPTIILSSKISHDSKLLRNRTNIIDYILKDSIYAINNLYRLVELLDYMENRKVLLVEDANIQAMQIKSILETLLLKVEVASNGIDALKILNESNDISMVLTDYDMPELNGLDLIKIIRKDKKYLYTPILVMSIFSDDELKINLYKNGANDYIIKPLTEEELKTKVLNIFSNSKFISETKEFNKIFDENIISSSTDAKGRILSVSKAFCEISGYSSDELIGRTHNIVRHPDMPESIFEDLWKTIKSGKVWKGEVKNRSKDGSFYWVSTIIEPKFDNQKQIIGFNSIRQDITDKKRIYELSIKDGLTSLYNRRYFNEIADKLMHKTIRSSNTFSFLILDIDNFKKYNDTYGHQKGDDVLVSVSDAISHVFKRSNDYVFRLGGEEFGVLMNTKTKNDALLLAESVRTKIESLNILHEKNLPCKVVTASFGLLIVKLEDLANLTINDVYKKADECLYLAKENGRNQVVTQEL